jgi:hypothetical protein
MVKRLTCEECGVEFVDVKNNRASRRFCSDRCRYRARDRRRYETDPEKVRERSRSYYWRYREEVLARRRQAKA